MDTLHIGYILCSLQPGESIVITYDKLHRAARDELTSLLFDHVRDSDVEDLANKLAAIHNLTVTVNPVSLDRTFHKPAERPKKQVTFIDGGFNWS